MKEFTAKAIFCGKQYKNTSTCGNPSYLVDLLIGGNYMRGFTGTNCSCGYSVSNHRNGDSIDIKYHFTRSGNMVITDMYA